MTEPKHCPNCNKKVGGGFLSTSYYLEPTAKNYINLHTQNNHEAYCNECGGTLIININQDIAERKEKLLSTIQSGLTVVPIVTSNSPLNWEYETIGIVSAQSVTGTGLLSELSSSFADIVGGQSSSLTGKLKAGEDICKGRIRYDCLMMGGNAIIATDIDYSEVGGGKGMLMVCMAGTAIKLKNIPSNLLDKAHIIEDLTSKITDLIEINKIKIISLV